MTYRDFSILETIRRAYILVLLILIYALGSTDTTSQKFNTQATTGRAENVFSDMWRSVESLNRSTVELPFGSREQQRLKQSLMSISEDLDFIQTVALKGRKRQIPEAYLYSLRLDSNLLEQTRDRTANGIADLVIVSSLELVANDLNMKATYIRSSRSSSLRLVEVLVHTVKSGRETGGYEVWYVPVGWVDEPGEHKRFGRLSSPTYSDLAPGNYFMWSRLDETEFKKTAISIGKNGRSRDEVDLVVK